RWPPKNIWWVPLILRSVSRTRHGGAMRRIPRYGSTFKSHFKTRERKRPQPRASIPNGRAAVSPPARSVSSCATLPRGTLSQRPAPSTPVLQIARVARCPPRHPVDRSLGHARRQVTRRLLLREDLARRRSSSGPGRGDENPRVPTRTARPSAGGDSDRSAFPSPPSWPLRSTSDALRRGAG